MKRHSREWYKHCRYTYAQRKAFGQKMRAARARNGGLSYAQREEAAFADWRLTGIWNGNF